jgi:hypothetical protein
VAGLGLGSIPLGLRLTNLDASKHLKVKFTCESRCSFWTRWFTFPLPPPSFDDGPLQAVRTRPEYAFSLLHAFSAHVLFRLQNAALLTLLLQPALLLIDFGHFQYNSVMLGLTIHALNAFASDRELLGAAFFVGALCFKQMALYYAPPIFGYLLGRCIAGGRKEGSMLFAQIGFTTIAAFAVMFAPWLWPPSAILDPVTRIFPVGRGLFEDKVRYGILTAPV